ncbi:MAG: type II secretion system protein, partial [Planctomycetota bacterium]
MRRRAFTIVELLVVVSIIALLIGILLPAISKTRRQARLTISQGNLRQLGQAHNTYAGAWNDRQFTLTDDNLSRYGTSASMAIGNYIAQTGQAHPAILLGWALMPGGNQILQRYVFASPGSNNALIQPISFGGPVDTNDVGDNA